MALPPHATWLERLSHVGIRALTLLVMGYLILPILVILPLSFTSGELLVYPLPAWSLRWYREFTTGPLWTQSTWNSLVLAVVTTVVATTVGLLAAFGLQGLRSPLKPVLFGLLALPLIIPPVMVAVALFYYYARLGLVGTFGGLVLAHTVLALPFVVITIAATLQGFEEFLRWAQRERSAGTHLCFGIIEPGTDMPVGIFQVRALEGGFRVSEWGFALAPEHWGTGLFVESARLALEFAFAELGVHRLEARAAIRNGRGNAALRKMGAVQEGVLRQSFFRNGQYMDQALWTILADDWLGRRREPTLPLFH